MDDPGALRGKLRFFLGGKDLEMETIRSLLEEHAPGRFEDANLSWGARSSDYREEIASCLAAEEVPALVELEDDLELDPSSVLLVDHHGERAGKDAATALEQVFELLDLPQSAWSRWHEVVAANDRAYLAGLQEAGASQEEMVRVRAADRRAQGVTEEEEDLAEAALGRLAPRFGGRLLVTDLPHARTSPLVDRLAPELGGPGFETLVVRSPEEVNVFGPGSVIEHLAKTFPEGWYGGNLPESGYFGRSGTSQPVLEVVEELLRGG